MGGAVVFDLDGTLVHNQAFRYAYMRLPERLGLRIDPRAFEEVFLETYYSLVRSGRLKEAFDWDNVARIALRRFGASYEEDAFLDLLVNGIRRGLVIVARGALEVLRELKKSGLVLGVLTNGYSKYQIPVLEATGIISLIDVVATNDLLEEPKPSLAAFRSLGSLIGCDVADMIYVGDHPYFDIYGAVVAGVGRIFWITKQWRPGTYRVGDLSTYIAKYTLDRYGVHISLDKYRNKSVRIIDSLQRVLGLVC